ncbi:MAG: hypothetical protein KJ718_04475 [Nanoarchaeota archaeon]|nr:hypothetical protein [Nanoarchaeota archaeon]
MEKEEEFIEHIHKEIKVQCSKPKDRQVGQFFIQIPKEIVRELNIKKGDVVIIDVPLKEKNKYSIKLKKGVI